MQTRNRRYRMMTRFHHRRVPLLVTVSGTGCSAKSTIAAELAEVLNLSHVVQTDVAVRLSGAMGHAAGCDWETPIWFRRVSSDRDSSGKRDDSDENDGGGIDGSDDNDGGGIDGDTCDDDRCERGEIDTGCVSERGPGAFLSLYLAECELARAAVAHDLDKCARVGKSMVLEGTQFGLSAFFQPLDQQDGGEYRGAVP